MLYLLGGAARAGKSTLAQRLLIEKRLPYFPIDVLTMGLTRGLPHLDLDPDGPDRVTGEKLWPIIRAVAENIIETDVTYLLEGATLLPAYVAELIHAHEAAVWACFIGYPHASPEVKVRAIRAFGGGPNDWVRNHTDAQLHALVDHMVDYSRYLQEECVRHNIPFFDGSLAFQDTLDQAFHYLTMPS